MNKNILVNLFILVTIIMVGIISGCIDDERTTDIKATVISLNSTGEELAYVNPPFVITGNISYYDVLVGNSTITVKSEKELKINSAIKLKVKRPRSYD